MKLDWDRPGVVRATLTVQELAALVASTRMAAASLAAASPEQAEELERVLAGFDRAAAHLGSGPRPVQSSGAAAPHAAGAGGVGDEVGELVEAVPHEA